jgi:hypothetical protein
MLPYIKHCKPSNVRNMAERSEKEEKQFVLGIISLYRVFQKELYNFESV